jgi:hypothetical protein
MLTTLCLAVAAGLGVAAIGGSRRRTLAVAAIICAVAFVDGWITAMPLGAPTRPFGIELPADAQVLELPIDDATVNVAAMYRGMLHGRPVVNGYAGYVPPHVWTLQWAIGRQDPSILTELRRGQPLYVAIAPRAEAPTLTAFLDAQHGARMIGVTGAGRVYALPPAPSRREVTLGARLAPAGGERIGEWLRIDLGDVRTVRAIDLRSRGHYTLLPPILRVETSLDGATWTPGAEDLPGGLAFRGVLTAPHDVPLRLPLADRAARYIRINAPAFSPDAITIYGP